MFLLNGTVERTDGVPPTTTLLDYLRLQAGLTGTKEGCAEGDCGACTVMISKRDADGALRHHAVNSCLMTIGQAAGLAVTTVEGVGGPDRLSPVQQALVEGDGAQCGYCTPGFVMAMTAFAKGGEEATEGTIHDMLAGNLCRCTGYRPIVEACIESVGADIEADDPSAADALDECAAPACLSGRGQVMHVPRSSSELSALLAEAPDAWILGGGTDMGLRFSKGRESPPTVISTGRVGEMRLLEAGEDGGLHFGGAVTYTELLPHLTRLYPAFADLVRRIGSRQIRNLGTIAGNLVTASPIGDTIPCLMALGAEVTLASGTGRRRILVEDFITGYRTTDLRAGEFIESVSIPPPGDGALFYAYKISKRFDQDISSVVLAATLTVTGGVVAESRLAIGGVGPRTLRLERTEAALKGGAWTEEAVEAALAILDAEIAPMDDFRASADYRRAVSGALLRRLYLESQTPDYDLRLEAL
ncbi:MAG: xanthine dehydrogenase small subunit [Alphaproteobacteria bacterium]|nr:xanthine dehydrogenase small subunit [Alphaproteobacteria bacterium]